MSTGGNSQQANRKEAQERPQYEPRLKEPEGLDSESGASWEGASWVWAEGRAVWTELEQGEGWAWARKAGRKAAVWGSSQALCLIQSQPNLAPLWKSGASGPSSFSRQLLPPQGAPWRLREGAREQQSWGLTVLVGVCMLACHHGMPFFEDTGTGHPEAPLTPHVCQFLRVLCCVKYQ